MLSESLAQAILATKITGPQLDAYLNTSQGLKAWRVLLNSRSLSLIFNKPSALVLLFESGVAIGDLLSINGAALAASDSATEAICKSGSALLTIVSDESLLNLWNNVPANKSRMSAQINAVGSKLGRQEFTSSGTFIMPASGIIALGYFGVGSGGSGGVGGSTGYGSGAGGSGGESKFGLLTTGLPAVNTAVTINTASTGSTNNSFGGLITLQNGRTGAYSGNSTSDVGTTTGSALYDTDIRNALFQIKTGTNKGGRGGVEQYGGTSNNSSGQAGVAGVTGSGGSGGLTSYSPYQANGGMAGTGLGSGAGSGAVMKQYVAATTAGQSAGASDFGSGGGGGGSSNNGSGPSGGSGKKGIFVFNYIIGD